MKNAFYFVSKALFVLDIFTFLSWFFGYIVRRLDNKTMVNFKIYDVTDWTTSKYNTYYIYCPIFQDAKATRQWNIFLEESYAKCVGGASARPFYKKSKSSIFLDQQSERL